MGGGSSAPMGVLSSAWGASTKTVGSPSVVVGKLQAKIAMVIASSARNFRMGRSNNGKKAVSFVIQRLQGISQRIHIRIRIMFFHHKDTKVTKVFKGKSFVFFVPLWLISISDLLSEDP